MNKKEKLRAYCVVKFCENGNKELSAEAIYDQFRNDPYFKDKNLDRREISSFLRRIDIIEKINFGSEIRYKLNNIIYKEIEKKKSLILENRRYSECVKKIIDEIERG